VRGERGVRLQLGEEAVLEDDATDRDVGRCEKGLVLRARVG